MSTIENNLWRKIEMEKKLLGCIWKKLTREDWKELISFLPESASLAFPDLRRVYTEVRALRDWALTMQDIVFKRKK